MARFAVARFLTVRLAVARFLVARFAVVLFADLRAGARLAVRFAADFRAAVFLAGLFRVDLLAAAFFTAIDTPSLGFNADLNADPVANRTPFDAGIGTAVPVRGFRPTRGPRALGVNDPNPTTVTFRPDRTSAMIVSNTPSTTSETVRRDESVDSLTARTSCDLFKITSSAIRHHVPAKWLFLPRSSISARVATRDRAARRTRTASLRTRCAHVNLVTRTVVWTKNPLFATILRTRVTRDAFAVGCTALCRTAITRRDSLDRIISRNSSEFPRERHSRGRRRHVRGEPGCLPRTRHAWMVPRVAATIGDGPRSATVGEDHVLDHPQRDRVARCGGLHVDQTGRARGDGGCEVTPGKVSPLRSDGQYRDHTSPRASSLVTAAVVSRLDRIARHRPGTGGGGRGSRWGPPCRPVALDRAGPGTAGAPPSRGRSGRGRHAHAPHLGGPAEGPARAADPRHGDRSRDRARPQPARRHRRHRRAGAERNLVDSVRRARRASGPSMRSSRPEHPISTPTGSSDRPTRCTSRRRHTISH